MPLCNSSARSAILNHSMPVSTRRTFSWWWRRGGDDWSSSLDDSFQRHMLRKQRILRYKYSKALRRRELWDRDAAHNAMRPTWGWKIPGLSSTNDGQTLSSKNLPQDTCSSQKTTGQEFLDDFAHFKDWVDRDPCGAVFGRRLASHQPPTSASWSSFSWMFDAKPSKQGEGISQEPAMTNVPPTSAPSGIASSNIRTALLRHGSLTEKNDKQLNSTSEPLGTAVASVDLNDEYEFDPISMRKILKPKPVVESANKKSKPLFDPLFSEKGVDIPVKSYKSHQVFGHTAKTSSARPKSKDLSDSHLLSWKAETSRRAELRSLKAKTLGNSIDTTAEYHGKWIPVAEGVEYEPMKNLAAESTTDEAPLFSGTTYEAKSKDILKGIKSFSKDWLNREGFRSKQESPIDVSCGGSALKAGAGPILSPTKIQPSLDRLKSTRRISGNLEPPVDPMTATREKTVQSQSPRGLAVEAQDVNDENLDRLRASDIRAATRNSSRAKPESENSKRDQKHENENDSKSLHENSDDFFPSPILESSRKLSEGLNHLWHQVRSQHKAWLTDKVQSSSNLQDFDVKKTPAPVGHKKQETQLDEVKAISDVRKLAIRPVQTFTPSQEVLDAEQENEARTLALRKANLEAKKSEAERRERETALARKIKATYEDEYGQITLNHRQVNGLARIDQPAESIREPNMGVEKHRIRDMIARCEDALMHTKRTRIEVMQKLKAIRASLEPSEAITPSPSWRVASNQHSTQSISNERVLVNDFARKSATEATQSPLSPPEFPPVNSPFLYKVLAYDSSTLQMTIAETTSSVSAPEDPSTQPLHPTEVLSRLNNVAKFLPYFADMEKQGYEIVSGSGDVLVFKKVRTLEAATKTSTTIIGEPPTASTPAESAPEPLAPTATTPSPSRVRRQEPVFSGSGQTWHQEQDSSSSNSNSNKGAEKGWFRQTLKRILMAGSVTAGLAYAIGVIAENAGAQVVQDVDARRAGKGRPGIYSTEMSR